jgi:hypothetical protein
MSIVESSRVKLFGGAMVVGASVGASAASSALPGTCTCMPATRSSTLWGSAFTITSGSGSGAIYQGHLVWDNHYGLKSTTAPIIYVDYFPSSSGSVTKMQVCRYNYWGITIVCAPETTHTNVGTAGQDVSVNVGTGSTAINGTGVNPYDYADVQVWNNLYSSNPITGIYNSFPVADCW